MATTSIGGLISGLDTASLINQLMQVEANPQTLLRQKVSSQQSVINSLQTVNAKIAGLATKAEALATAAGWGGLSVTSSSDKVTAATTSKATAGTVAFTVVATAKPHQISYGQTAALTDRVTSPDSTVVRITADDGTFTDIDTGNGTLDGLVQAIGKSTAGVRASTIRLDDGTYRLRLESNATGEDSSFTMTNLDGSDVLSGATVSAGRDAAITIGADTIHSSSNTFKGAVAGLDITLSGTTPPNTDIELRVSLNSAAVTSTVKSMIDAVNSVLGDIDSLTSYNTTTKAAGVLVGDTMLRSLRNELLSAVSSGSGGTSLADVGIQLDRTGKLKFDETVFATAYAADPQKTASRFTSTATWTGTGTVTLEGSTWRTDAGSHAIDATAGTIGGVPATLSGDLLTGAAQTAADGLTVRASAGATGTLSFSQGFAAKMAALAQRASDADEGTVSGAVKGRTDSITEMNEAITAWDQRLTVRRQSLERQYSALEVALSKLQNQSSWLASQIGSLPSTSS